MFEAFFLGMIIPTGFIAIGYIAIKFTLDMRKEYRKDKLRAKANRNMFQL